MSYPHLKSNTIRWVNFRRAFTHLMGQYCTRVNNPIEHAWANLKQAIKSNKHQFESFETNLAAQIQIMNHSNMA